MNYYFGLKNSIFSSEILIPFFKNKETKPENILLYKASILNNVWRIEKINNNKVSSEFFIIKSNDHSNSDIFF